MSLQGWFDSLRKWIDGEEDLDEAGQPRARSRWDDFLVAVAREVEECMQREMFTPPGGPTYVPREYIVFLSPDDDSDWQGEKREGLERGLYHVLSERARELAGENEFQTKTLTVELRVDPNLEKGKFRVQHVWDTEAQKTMVKPRPRTTVLPDQSESAAQGMLTVAEEREDESTVVRPRKTVEPTFSVAVSRQVPGADSAPPDIRPFYKDEVSVGRGSRQVTVDLRLEGDLEVSRKHATIARRGDGTYAVTCHGANPILLDGGREIPAGESAEVRPGDKIVICSYELAIQ
jgi:FHA domain-containing protein